MEPVTIDELPGLVGRHSATSDWLAIKQERVDEFARATGDYQWIHVDRERAQKIGGTIAHGYLTLSLIPVLSEGLLPVSGISHGFNYGSDKIRYLAPVRVGSRIRVRKSLIEAAAKSNGMLLRHECVIEIEGEPKPACVAETLTLLFGDPG